MKLPWRHNNIDDATLPKEVQDYYEAEKRERVGVASMLAIGTLIITIILAVGIFFGGRWVWRHTFHHNKNVATTATVHAPDDKSSSSTSPSNTGSNKSSSSNAGANGSTATGGGTNNSAGAPSSGSSTTGGSASSTNGTPGSSAAAGSPTNSSTTPNPSASSHLPNTGPGNFVPAILGVIAIGVISAELYQRRLVRR